MTQNFVSNEKFEPKEDEYEYDEEYDEEDENQPEKTFEHHTPPELK